MAGPQPEALASFQHGMEAMQRHHYADAVEQFSVLIARYPGERGLLDRARVYLDHCERELRKQPAAPKTIEERLTAATAALNLGEEDEAEKFAEKGDRLLPVLAHAASGDVPATIAAMEKARGRDRYLVEDCYRDPDLGPILRSEPFAAFRERFPEPKTSGVGTFRDFPD